MKQRTTKQTEKETRERKQREEREQKERAEENKRRQKEEARLLKDREQEVRSAAYVSANNGDTDAVIEAVEKGGVKVSGWESLGNDTKKNMAEESLFHIAARKGNFTLGTFLLKKGADVNAITKLGKAPIHLACAGEGDYLDFVKLLLEDAGVNIHSKAVDSGEHPIHVAAKTGRLALTQYLVEKGAYLLPRMFLARTHSLGQRTTPTRRALM